MALASSAGNTLAKHSFRNFIVQYSSTYTSFTVNHVLADRYHPLYRSRMRVEEERQKIGLWWHVTATTNSAKKSTVRAWMRRRLRWAFCAGLEERGISETGKILSASETKTPAIKALLDQDKSVSLSGSIRLQVRPALLTAKYEDVKRETSSLLDILLRHREKELAAMFQAGYSQQWRTRAKPTARTSYRREGVSLEW